VRADSSDEAWGRGPCAFRGFLFHQEARRDPELLGDPELLAADAEPLT